MPQMSSTDRVLMAAQYIKDALKHPQPDVPFATIGEDTLSALATLAELFMLIPQVRMAHKYPNSPWEMIHPPGGDNAVGM
jgi:hypothetical protein